MVHPEEKNIGQTTLVCGKAFDDRVGVESEKLQGINPRNDELHLVHVPGQDDHGSHRTAEGAQAAFLNLVGKGLSVLFDHLQRLRFETKRAEGFREPFREIERLYLHNRN
jgi:hypothetical protein